MVDGAYDLINEKLRPGVRENDIVAEVNKFLYTHGSDDVEAINAISGERCNPHPHNFTDRMIRPGDQAFFDILQSFMGYRTCYYRTFNVGKATAAQRDAYRRRANGWTMPWRGSSRAPQQPISAAMFPTAEKFGFPDEMSAFGLQFAHGLGLALHERPMISRVISMDHPTEIKEGMVFAIETYCPATDGYSAARIEEEVVVTDKGCRVISLFPAETLPIANPTNQQETRWSEPCLSLYSAPQSTCSQKVRLTLAEKHLEFVEHKMKLFQNDQLRPEYLKLNPNGVVPTLVDDGAPVINSSVIMEYLDEVYPEVPLSPDRTGQTAAQMRAWLRFFEEVPTVAVRFPSYNAAFARHFEKMSDEEFKDVGEVETASRQVSRGDG